MGQLPPLCANCGYEFINGKCDCAIPMTNKKLTEEQEKHFEKAIDYILDVTKKQGRLLTYKELYGDGTRWKLLTEKGFEMAFNAVKATLIFQGYRLDTTQEEALCKCGKQGTKELHSCPYQCEINDDHNDICNCCSECSYECAMDV